MPQTEEYTVVNGPVAPHVEIQISSLKEKPTAAGLGLVERNIESLADLMREATRSRNHSETVAARLAARAAEVEAVEAEKAWTTAEALLANLSPASMWRLFVCLTFGVLAGAGEYAVSWMTLPALLGIEPESVLGLLVAFLPVAAAKALETPFGWVWDLVAHWWKSPRALVKTCAFALAATLVSTIIGANMLMLLYQGPAREESAKVLERLTAGDAEASVDHQAAGDAILVVSIVVVLDGALFFLLIDRELDKLRHWIRARRSVRRSRQRLDSARTALRQALHDEQVHNLRWDSIEAVLGPLKEAFISKHLFDVEQLPAPKQPSLTLEERVDQRLGIHVN
jgi:hypothetical protein